MATPVTAARSDRSRARKVAWLYFAVVASMTAAGIVLLWLTRDAPRNEVYALESIPVEVLDRIQFLLIAAIGAVVIGRQPRNPVGWVIAVMGFGFPMADFSEAYARYALEVSPGSLPAGTTFAWFTNWVWALTILGLPLAFLLFPNGSFPTRRWEPVAYIALANVAYAIAASMFVDPEIDGFPGVANPTQFVNTGVSLNELVGPSFILLLGTMIAGLVSLLVRYRRADAELRAQLRWFLYAAAMFCLYLTLTIVFEMRGLPNVIGGLAVSIGLTAAIAIAILKYRLYDIDVVINKTIVFAVLAAFITAVYVAIVVGAGSLLGSQDEPNLALSIFATAIVAIAFSPVKERTQRIANRLVYGQRATPYEALSRFSDEVATSYETEQVAPAMAKTIVDATGAERASVWLVVGDKLEPAAVHPETELSQDAIALDGHKQSLTLPDIKGAHVASPVVHKGELLGALTLTKKRGEQSTEMDAKLLGDLSSQAGIVLRNSRLTAELEARLQQITATAKEIRESRRRIVATQDKARRQLERDIHDGAQQHLVALAVKLNLAKTMARKKPERAETILDQLKEDAREALETLDELARGIYPPVLAEHGIARAIEGRAAKAPFDVTIEDHTSSRYDSHVEAALYFCILEALQNVAKYAGATTASVTLTDRDGTLAFTVTDDGSGFDPATTDYGTGVQGMADRLAAVGGTVELTSAPGKGTTVAGGISYEREAVA